MEETLHLKNNLYGLCDKVLRIILKDKNEKTDFPNDFDFLTTKYRCISVPYYSKQDNIEKIKGEIIALCLKENENCEVVNINEDYDYQKDIEMLNERYEREKRKEKERIKASENHNFLYEITIVRKKPNNDIFSYSIVSKSLKNARDNFFSLQKLIAYDFENNERSFEYDKAYCISPLYMYYKHKLYPNDDYFEMTIKPVLEKNGEIEFRLKEIMGKFEHTDEDKNELSEIWKDYVLKQR